MKNRESLEAVHTHTGNLTNRIIRHRDKSMCFRRI